MTFADATRKYFEQHQHKWRNPRHRAQFLISLEQYVFPIIGTLPVAVSMSLGAQSPRKQIDG